VFLQCSDTLDFSQLPLARVKTVQEHCERHLHLQSSLRPVAMRYRRLREPAPITICLPLSGISDSCRSRYPRLETVREHSDSYPSAVQARIYLRSAMACPLTWTFIVRPTSSALVDSVLLCQMSAAALCTQTGSTIAVIANFLTSKLCVTASAVWNSREIHCKVAYRRTRSMHADHKAGLTRKSLFGLRSR